MNSKFKVFFALWSTIFSIQALGSEINIECSDDRYRYNLHVSVDLQDLAQFSREVMKTSYIGTFTKTWLNPNDNAFQQIEVRTQELTKVNKCLMEKFAKYTPRPALVTPFTEPKALKINTSAQHIDSSTKTDPIIQQLAEIQARFENNDVAIAYNMLGKISGFIKAANDEKLKKAYRNIVDKYLSDGVLVVDSKPLAKINAPAGTKEGIFLRSFLNNSYLNTGKINLDILLLDEFDPLQVLTYQNSGENCPKNSSKWGLLIANYKNFINNGSVEFVNIIAEQIYAARKPIGTTVSQIADLLNTCIRQTL